MAIVKPFRGVLYKEKLRSSEVMAPPYDVIDDRKRESLKKSSVYNIVNITLPDSYDKAKELLDEWFEIGVLQLDDDCSFYLYSAEYIYDGVKKLLKGIVGALKIEPFGKYIKPHEKTLKGPKIDRFNLITTTNAMFCPIIGLYNKCNEIKNIFEKTVSKKPIYTADFEDINHNLYKITGTDDIKTIEKALLDRSIIIADGHHRYETALMIKDYFNSKGLKHGWFDYIMILLVDAESGGLSLSAIHRVVKQLEDFDRFVDRLSEYFFISEKEVSNYDFIMYYQGRYYWLTLKFPKSDDLLKRLNSSIFEDYVYKKILGLKDSDIKNQDVSGYAHSLEELKSLVDTGKAKVGFILKPMSFGELVEVTENGLTVPQKSTYFYPKIPSGLVGYCKESIKGCEDV